MSAPHVPKVAGIEPALPAPAHTADPRVTAPPADPSDPADSTGSTGSTDPASDASADGPSGTAGTAQDDARPDAPGAAGGPSPVDRIAAVQDRLAGWISDLSTLHDLTERLVRTRTLDDALRELLRAGAFLVGARRGLVVLAPQDGLGPKTSVGLGLGHAEIGHLETVPRRALSYARILDGLPEPGAGDDAGAEARTEIAEPDIPGEKDLDPRLREVAARLGYAASYAVPLTAGPVGRIGAAVWLYDEPAEPGDRRRHLVGLYRAHAAEHLARLLELHRSRQAARTLRDELLPRRLPRIPGVRLAVRHATGPCGGGDWYDALPLPDGALGLAVGSVTGSGPSAVAAMGRLRASLRAYAVMEGEDPVAVLSDLELLMRLTEPARSATALFAFTEPPGGPGGPRCRPRSAGRRRARWCWPGPATARRWSSATCGRSSWRPRCPRRWACWPAGRRPAWRSSRPPARPCSCTATGCCTAPASRWIGRSPVCTPRPPASPGPAGTTRRPWWTTSCGPCCRRDWTTRPRRRTWFCSRPTSRSNGVTAGHGGGRGGARPPGPACGTGHLVRPLDRIPFALTMECGAV
ncbi:magnesium or manganese-dependent protein phosphatase [Streptomyces noursei]|nr:magnesium or manganese-dependent protein phosphatase [Streptomyces noursei]